MRNLIVRAGLIGALTLLLAGCAVGLNDPDPRAAPAIAGGEGSVGALVLNDVYLRGPVVRGGSPEVALSVSNTGERPDRLVGASSPAAAAVTIARRRLEIPALGTVNLEDGHTVTLRDARRSAVDGATVPITFRFARAGSVTVYAAVENNPGIS